jgi:H+/Cl- antiporter ClcA
VIASVSAYVVFVSLVGSTQTFDVPTFSLFASTHVIGYLILTLVSAPVGRMYVWLFHATRDRVFVRFRCLVRSCPWSAGSPWA